MEVDCELPQLMLNFTKGKLLELIVIKMLASVKLWLPSRWITKVVKSVYMVVCEYP